MKDDVVTGNPLRGLNGAIPPAPTWFTDAVNAPFESAVLEVNGVPIEYRAWGDRGKPGLVFIHGNAAHLGWWSFLTPLFAADYRVVAPSLSGMGASGWRDRDYSIDDYVAEALATAEAGGACLAGPPIMIGHSLGGLPVLRAAAGADSHRIRAGITVDSGLPGPEMDGTPPRSSERTYPDLPSALDRFRLSPIQPCENLYIADHLGRMGVKQLDDGSWGWRFDRKLWGQIELGDSWADLAGAKVPLAFIRGDHSVLTGGAMGERIRATAPAGSPFIDIPEAYHHVMVDQPLALVASLRTLLAAWA
ncbi:alpha/beta hydrolase [soil metagenome]